MKANFSDTNDFVQSMNRGKRKKKIALLVLCIVLAFLVAACVVVGLKIRENNRIAMAKSVITKLDISTTFKESEFSDDQDWDGDGIKNADEVRHGTNLQSEDTDNDGISDGDETKLGTNPIEADTDGDGLLDGYELMAGTNPRESKSDGKTNDAERELTVEKNAGDCRLEIKGDANAASTTLVELDLFGISSNASIVTKAYDAYSDYKFNSAKITFDIDSAKLSKMGYSFDDLTVLRFDSRSTLYTKVDSKADKSKKTVSASLTELGTYVVGVEKTVNDEATTRICFLVDNSGSMYPKEQCVTSSENDVDFKRLEFAKNLIDKFESHYQVGICKFTGSYKKMVDFTDDKTKLTEALDKIKSEEEIFNGTHSQTALKKCMGEFKATSGGKYRNIIVMLTDGESDESNPASVSSLANTAKDKDIIVLTVGLGRDVDRDWLQELAYSTGGKYYSASDANALNDVYKQIVTTLNYDIVTYTNADDNVRGYSLYNTGFDPKVNGFSFKNFRTTTTASVDFGMAVMARDWYLGNVKTSLGDIAPSDKSDIKVNAAGYDISGTDFGKQYAERVPLSKITSDLFAGTYSDVTKYLDYSCTGDILTLNDDYKYDSKNKGWVKDITKISGGNLRWKKVELLDMDIANGIDKIKGGYSSNDAEFAKALYRLNALQWDDSSSEYNLNNDSKGFEKLEDQLSLGIPVVTTIDDTHTVNAIGLIQDSDCHRKYILQIYDNNYPGETKQLYIQKLPKCKLKIDSNGKATVVGTTFEYSATYEGKQVGIEFSDVTAH